jgi:serine/threonine-protein kinase
MTQTDDEHRLDTETFREIYETLSLDETLPASASIRPDDRPGTGPTLALTSLPAVSLGATTNPELELGDTIGEGGMGIVRSAQQLALHREVAVKTLRDDRKTEEARDGLLHEALVTGGLEHPNVTPVYSLGQTEDGSPVIVMKRIEGIAWCDCIDDVTRAPSYDGDDPLEWHLDVFTQVCLAVHFAHSRGIVHRDIKPENVMVGAYGEVYLLDWGIAATFDKEKADYLQHVDDSDGVYGTPHYMAPEMTTGSSEEVGPHTDVYLLGATLYHVLSGEPPHSGKTLFEIMFSAYESPTPELPGIPDELADVCRRAMAREPDERFESADALRRAVVEFQRHRTSITLADEATERLDELRQQVEQSEDPDETRIRNLFGECRFGFGQSLRVWPENPEASRGLQTAIEEMALYEIDAENLGAAEGLVRELDEPGPSTLEALEDLRSALKNRQAEIAELRELRDDVDLSTGARPRAIGAVIGVLTFTMMPLVAGWSFSSGLIEPTMQDYFVHGFSVLGFIALLVFVLRSAVMKNRANRKLVRMLLAYGIWTPAFRLVAWMVGLDMMQALNLEFVSYSVMFAAVAILSDRFAFFGMAVYIVGALLAAQLPAWMFELTAVSNLFALGWLALIWARQGETSQTDPA